eukprot:15066617-Alexandrium_andersonii.AAC.1
MASSLHRKLITGKATEVRSQLAELSKNGDIDLPGDFNIASATKDAMAKLIVEKRMADAKAEEQALAKQWQDRPRHLHYRFASPPLRAFSWQC